MLKLWEIEQVSKINGFITSQLIFGKPARWGDDFTPNLLAAVAQNNP